MIADRIARAQTLLVEHDLDVLMLGPSADFRYLTGRHVGPSERLTALLVPARGRPAVVVPRLTAPLLDVGDPTLDLRTWEDGAQPLDLVRSYLGDHGAGRVGVGEEFRSSFLLELIESRPAVRFTSAGPLLCALRVVKQAAEIRYLRIASHRADLAWRDFCETVSVIGRTEVELVGRLAELMRKHELTDTAWIDVGSGPNSASPLHAGGNRRVAPGDPITIDFSAAFHGYFADICRTVVAGEPTAEFVEAYEVVREAQQAAVNHVRPGVACGEVDGVARKLIARRGYGGFFTHRLGHGIGMAPHEHPYLVEGNAELLEAGMTFSVEPGIYVPGAWGIRIEDIVAVSQTAGERLNDAPRALLSLN